MPETGLPVKLARLNRVLQLVTHQVGAMLNSLRGAVGIPFAHRSQIVTTR